MHIAQCTLPLFSHHICRLDLQAGLFCASCPEKYCSKPMNYLNTSPLVQDFLCGTGSQSVPPIHQQIQKHASPLLTCSAKGQDPFMALASHRKYNLWGAGSDCRPRFVIILFHILQNQLTGQPQVWKVTRTTFSKLATSPSVTHTWTSLILFWRHTSNTFSGFPFSRFPFSISERRLSEAEED